MKLDVISGRYHLAVLGMWYVIALEWYKGKVAGPRLWVSADIVPTHCVAVQLLLLNPSQPSLVWMNTPILH